MGTRGLTDKQRQAIEHLERAREEGLGLSAYARAHRLGQLQYIWGDLFLHLLRRRSSVWLAVLGRRVTSLKKPCAMLVALASYSAVNPAGDLSIATIGHSKPRGSVIDCVVDERGSIVVLQRDSGQVTKLLRFSESKALIDEKIVDPVSYFLRSIRDDILIGSFGDKKTLLRTSKLTWTLPGVLSDVQIYQRDRNVFVVGISHAGDRKKIPAAWKLSDEGSTTPTSIDPGSSGKPKQLFSSQRAIYGISDQGLHRLRVNGTQLGFELLVKARFNRGSVASLGQTELAALVPTKMMVQNELELRLLPDGEIVETLKYPYSAVSVSLAGGKDDQALLLVKSKESLGQAEIILLDKAGHPLQRKKVNYHSQLVTDSHDGSFILVNPDEIVEVKLERACSRDFGDALRQRDLVGAAASVESGASR